MPFKKTMAVLCGCTALVSLLFLSAARKACAQNPVCPPPTVNLGCQEKYKSDQKGLTCCTLDQMLKQRGGELRCRGLSELDIARILQDKLRVSGYTAEARACGIVPGASGPRF
jgi:hypothetical protein